MTEPVRLTVVPDEGAAAIVCGLLETEGIPSFARRSDVAAGAADAGVSFGGWREILVRPEDLERARALVEGTEAAPQE